MASEPSGASLPHSKPPVSPHIEPQTNREVALPNSRSLPRKAPPALRPTPKHNDTRFISILLSSLIAIPALTYFWYWYRKRHMDEVRRERLRRLWERNNSA
ncbi:hypothetical protein K470DRAFT_254593 [Piedraia hortae CBS 480.64]|uniref:Uncharacterized protein n=1 Tax=Piedraia hortae CBS 480.64 TaxID=1314780 RepID=A0A6A7CAQ8_9PEZI|nr:hypothetical protein K470DRAFT_254593 [Piedraia hortae CBS 480.64]